MLRLTVVVENTVGMPFLPGVTPGMLGEHGFALLIDTPQGRWLYDTGRGKSLVPNLATLGVDPDSIAGVILSHGHQDHTSGLLPLLKARTCALPVYGHPDIFQEKYMLGQDQKMKRIGLQYSGDELRDAGGVFSLAKGPTRINASITITGAIPRKNPREAIKDTFFVRKDDDFVIDTIEDDQALVLDSGNGLHIITGCAHAGLINTYNYVKALNQGKEVLSVIGGLHLAGCDEPRWEDVVALFRKTDIRTIAACHCTGFYEMARLAMEFPKQFFHLTAGTIFTL